MGEEKGKERGGRERGRKRERKGERKEGKESEMKGRGNVRGMENCLHLLREDRRPCVG